MFLQRTKTAFVDALRAVFTETYPEREFRDLSISIEYPIERESYPTIWVNFTPMGQIQGAGVGHEEITLGQTKSPDGSVDHLMKRHTRFTFEGVVTFTVVALTSREKDALFDQMQRVLMAGTESRLTRAFRDRLESSTFIAITPTYENVDVSGDSASPGSPWGGESDVIYEISLSMHTFGEFYVDPEASEIVELSRIVVHPEVDVALPYRDVDIMGQPEQWIGSR
ncbi:hypothetical protein [Dermacoccus nishinomiyaensis]|uniref:hypothetical protein n=1 Tax=Dermacoccus nishinomiyaensis TaxID=1274 RepID=UPI00248F1684|nr:hypothetical protein [Dermacoccus nishinomiyaensis]